MAYDLPITISEGDFSDPSTGVGTTPLGKIAVRFSEAVINTAWTKAEAAAIAATAKASAISGQVDGIIASPGDYHVTAGSVAVPTVTAPNVSIPVSIDTSTILATFDTEYPLIATFLKNQADYIVATYFPSDAALYTAADAWLTTAIADGGIPDAVKAQIIGDADAIVIEDKLKAQDAVVAMYQARRFPLLPDVAAAAVLQIEQKAQDQMAETARKVSILSLENMKWAIDKVKELRGLALTSMVQYAQAIGRGAVDTAASITGLGYGEQAKLISAAASFYGADTNAKEMMSKVAQFNENIALEGSMKNQAANLELVNQKVKALLADMQSTMQTATALYNNLHASAGTTLSV